MKYRNTTLLEVSEQQPEEIMFLSSYSVPEVTKLPKNFFAYRLSGRTLPTLPAGSAN
jgi:hypothetical protein